MDTDTDYDIDRISTAAGNIDMRDGTDKGLVSIQRAFSFYSSSATLIIASSNPDATCETFADLLDPEAPATDRTSLYLAGHCNLTFTLNSAPPSEATTCRPTPAPSSAHLALLARANGR
ncbi:MAG: hypothetical protein IPI35_18450 [Deltaproteobacteria bacterium]|nr:hypothetical protein [Deltaproteobacteria bacterium]